ncbi:MAG: GTP 3',8-cyclase MoaA [Desulfuromonadaceae bacterium]|nr:GTP 3',8-cyclase MoaA [Desulfuromonadaceae bacterium]MDD5104979.1 GTP 3',8-cyclase MoaA [Desulfuromonadaceae bacterium]
MALHDSIGRTINYLRLSVTDRCNLRCRYCMPEDGIAKFTHGDILSYEELFRIARVAVSIGIDKIRITGGEPLVRKGIIPFLQQLAGIPGLEQLVLTTNGVLLEKMAPELRSSGVQRLNISLDSLNPETFRQISRCGDLKFVLAGIDAAKECGFPIKLNMVVMRGINDHELMDFVNLATTSAVTVRFIEYMPAIREHNWQRLVVPGAEILARLEQRFTLIPLEQAAMAGPARNFRIPGSHGSLGVITPVSHHFCSECNRIRVTASGLAKGCLFAGDQMDLKSALQSGSNQLLASALCAIVDTKPDRHHMCLEECHHQAFSMSSIGG